MEEIIVKQNKNIFIIGITTSLFFLIVTILSVYFTWQEQNIIGAILCFFMFGLSTCLGGYLILSYIHHTLYLGEQTCYVVNAFNHKKEFTIQDVDHVMIILHEVYTLRDKRGNKLAGFEQNQPEYDDIMNFLKEHDIPFIRSKSFKNKSESTMELDKELEDAYFQKTSVKEIKKRAKIIRYMDWLGVVFVLVSFVSSVQIRVWFYLLYPLFTWGLMLVFHRTMIIIKPKKVSRKWSNRHIKFPFITNTIVVLLMMKSMNLFNVVNVGLWIVFIIGFTILLLIPYLVVTKQSFTIKQTGFISLLLLLYAFASSVYINDQLPAVYHQHSKTEIITMRKTTGSRNESYYITAILPNGKEEEVVVSRSIYNKYQLFDEITICDKQSIFGIRMYYVF